jgi:hypothetical protein
MSEINKIPNLEVERSYYSDGTVPDQGIEINSSEQDTSTNVFDDIADKIDALKSASNAMPKDMSDLFDNLVANAEYILNLIDQDVYDPDLIPNNAVITIPNPEDEVISPNDSDVETDPNNDDDFDIFSVSRLDNIKIEIPTIDLKIFVDNNYYGDLFAVLSEYVTSLESSAAKYIANIMSLASDANISDLSMLTMPYNTKSSDIKDKNLIHLSDAIIRSAVIRKQKVNFLRKINTPRETSLHVKSCKAASEFKARYLQEEYKNPSNILDLYNNAILSESVNSYEKKYEENFRNLYKYLNSSVILINECLMTFLKEAQGKAILINKGEIKL